MNQSENSFHPIGFSTWPRAKQFRLYTETWSPVSFSACKNIDVTKAYQLHLKKGVSFTCLAYYLITKAINQKEYFRYGYDENKVFGYFDHIYPLFPTMDKNENLLFHQVRDLSSLASFTREYEKEIQIREREEILPPFLGNDFFSLSNALMLDVDSFSMHLKHSRYYFQPMVELLRIKPHGRKYLLPVSITVSHAVNDGIHLSRLFEDIQYQFQEIDKLWKK